MDKIEGLKDIMDLKKELIEETTHQFKNGIQNVDTNEAMNAIDMIKDLAEAEEKCVKACYYQKIIESMEEAENDRYGYNPNYNGGRRYREPDVFYERMGYEPSPNTRDFHDYMTESNLEKWRNAKRHYQSSHSAADKEEMNGHAKAHLAETMATLKEIMANSDPDLQKRMKNDLTNLINEIV